MATGSETRSRFTNFQPCFRSRRTFFRRLRSTGKEGFTRCRVCHGRRTKEACVGTKNFSSTTFTCLFVNCEVFWLRQTLGFKPKSLPDKIVLSHITGENVRLVKGSLGVRKWACSVLGLTSTMGNACAASASAAGSEEAAVAKEE